MVATIDRSLEEQFKKDMARGRRMKTKKIKTFYDNVFNATFGIEIGNLSDEHFDAETEVQEKTFKNRTWVRYIARLQNKNDFYALIHETLHLVKNIFNDRKIPFTAENHEIIAYYQTYLFKKLWRSIHKPKLK